MGYLDLASYEKMMAKRNTDAFGFTADSFGDKVNRTLTLGKNSSGTTLHVYIKDDVLHAHEYLDLPGDGYFTVTWLEGTIAPTALNPNFYAVPVVTDQEFADLMLRFSHPLDFAEWNSVVNQADESPAGYFGRIIQMDPTTHPMRFH